MKSLLRAALVAVLLTSGATAPVLAQTTSAATPTSVPRTAIQGSFADGQDGPTGLNVLSLFSQFAGQAAPNAGSGLLGDALNSLGATGQTNHALGCTGTTGSGASTGCFTSQAGGGGFAALAVPEPGAALLLGSALLGLALRRRGRG